MRRSLVNEVLRRAWLEYESELDHATIYNQTTWPIILVVFACGAAIVLLLTWLDRAKNIGGFRSPWIIALLAAGLTCSALLHRATAPTASAPRVAAAMNVLDTALIAAFVSGLAAATSHPTDCLFAALSMAAVLVWGMSPFAWPMLVAAAIWPVAIQAILRSSDVVHLAIVSFAVPLYVIFAVGHGRRRLVQLEREAAARSTLAEAGRLATLGRLEASIAHEMGQPLTAIAGFVQRLQRHLPEGSRDEAEPLLAASMQLRQILEQIQFLGVPRPSGRRRLSLAEPVEDALLLMRRQLELRGIEVVWARPAGEAFVLGDRQRLGQLVINLLANARDAVSSLPAGRPRRIRILVLGGGGRVTLAVSDTGPGVPPELAPHVFDPFFTTKEPPSGSGLGLAICRDIIREHDGTLELEPRGQDGGALLWVTLPMCDGDRATS
jgi:signal transduction histidine kinase